MERGKTALAEICVDGCDVLAKTAEVRWAAIFLRMLSTSDRIYTAAALVDTWSEFG